MTKQGSTQQAGAGALKTKASRPIEPSAREAVRHRSASRRARGVLKEHYLLPAEWTPHAATWIAWPHHRADWPGKFEPIPWVYAEIVKAITLGEMARILVRGEREEAAARVVLSRAGVSLRKVEFYHVPTNRVWLRDSGPTFVKGTEEEKSKEQEMRTVFSHEPSASEASPIAEGSSPQQGHAKKPRPAGRPSPEPVSSAEQEARREDNKTLLNWRFNAWAKYSNHRLDNKVPEHLAEITGYELVEPQHQGKRVVLEGGAIDVNGTGLLLTTEECLLSESVQCRNPGFTRDDYEDVFARYLGIEHTIWLGNGIAGDDTHGHVDDIARFVAEDTVVTVVETNRDDVNYAPLQDNLKRLKQTGLNIVELPMPRPVIFEDERLPASYANFLITNAAVIVPVFNDPHDRVALNILAECFPERQVIPIYATDLVWGFGTIHCLSQQEPA